MIEDAVKAVKEAEQKADKIVGDARKEAEKIKSDAESEAELMKKKASEEADENYQTILHDAEIDGKKFVETEMTLVEKDVAAMKALAGTKKAMAVDKIVSDFT